MTTRWTQSDIDRFNEKKGKLRPKDSGAAPVPGEKKGNYPQNRSFALGRMKGGTMNKTEQLYSDHLEFRKRAGEVLWYEFEPMNLRLAEKCFYQVDFLVMLTSGQLECHEVKGYWQDDARVKIKTAAAKFPFRFIAVRLVKGYWEVREF